MIFNIRHYISIFSCLIYALLLTASNNAQGVEIVRLNITYDNTVHVMDIELFDVTAPLTVANYLDYVNSTDIVGIPKFDGTFIYRNIPGFILQAGGYTFRPPNPLVDALISPTVGEPVGLNYVASGLLSPVQNEFNLSNIRGTIAMAKVPAQFIEGGDCVAEIPGICTLVTGSGPDSATREWFINLSDNTSLDAQNGGFTVFGSIIDDGIQIADEISTFPIRQFAAAALRNNSFSDLPVVNYNPIDSPDYNPNVLPAVLQEHLVMITTISSQVSRPILRFTPTAVDFPLDVAGDGIPAATINVIVKNTGNEVLTIDTINTANVSAPFSIVSDTCSDAVLATPLATPTNSCTISYTFSPTATGDFTDTLPITYWGTLPSTPNYTVTAEISGEGVPQSPVLNISQSNIQIRDTLVNTASDELTISIQNKGGDPLYLNTPTFTGIDSGDFSITNTTCDTSAALSIGTTCSISIQFSPTVAGVKTASLSIQSNGGNIDTPINALATIPEISVNTSMLITAQIGSSTSNFLSVNNGGTADLIITNAVISGTDASLFSQENNCPETINVAQPLGSLAPNGSCNFLIKYTPSTNAETTALLTLESNDPLTPSVNITLNGISGNPDISVPGSFDTGTSQINGYSTQKELIITNNGSTALVITDILGLNSTNFSQTNNCVGTGIKVAPGGSCSIFITFSTSSSGEQTAVMTLESNDPDTPSANVNLSAFGDKDSDGVVSSVEASSPNSGDGNYDDIADELQNSVASLVALNSSYITFVADNSLISNQSTTLVDIKLLSAPYIDLPGSASFDFGLFSYSITLPEGDGTDIAIILPPNVNPTVFYKYGPTADNTEPHWYEFSYDAATGTGAQYYGNMTFTSPSGKKGSKNLVIVRYIDGSKGDDDMEANGVIVNAQSGLSFSKPSATDSGSLSALSLLVILIINIFRRENFQQGIRRRLKYISH